MGSKVSVQSNISRSETNVGSRSSHGDFVRDPDELQFTQDHLGMRSSDSQVRVG